MKIMCLNIFVKVSIFLVCPEEFICALTGNANRVHTLTLPPPSTLGSLLPFWQPSGLGGQNGLGMGLQSRSGASRMTLPWCHFSDGRTEAREEPECPVT